MKALLLAPVGWEKEGSQSIRLWPGDRTIPAGGEEVELEATARFRGTTLRGNVDLCQCGDYRRSHAKHRDKCLVEPCKCSRFEEAG